MQLAGQSQNCPAADAARGFLPAGLGEAAHLTDTGGGRPERHGLGVQLQGGAHSGTDTFLCLCRKVSTDRLGQVLVALTALFSIRDGARGSARAVIPPQ